MPMQRQHVHVHPQYVPTAHLSYNAERRNQPQIFATVLEILQKHVKQTVPCSYRTDYFGYLPHV